MKSPVKIYIILFFLNSSLYAQNSFKNNFSIKPFNANAIGLGLGMQYERYLDSSRNFSLVIPVDFSVELTETNWNNDQFGINTNPGLRLYFKEPRAFNWYIGTSIIIGTSRESGIGYDWQLQKDFTYIQNRFQFGTYVNVGFKGTIAKRFTYNVELGNGIRLIDKYTTTMDGLQQPISNTNRSKYIASILAGIGYNF